MRTFEDVAAGIRARQDQGFDLGPNASDRVLFGKDDYIVPPDDFGGQDHVVPPEPPATPAASLRLAMAMPWQLGGATPAISSPDQGFSLSSPAASVAQPTLSQAPGAGTPWGPNPFAAPGSWPGSAAPSAFAPLPSRDFGLAMPWGVNAFAPPASWPGQGFAAATVGASNPDAQPMPGNQAFPPVQGFGDEQDRVGQTQPPPSMLGTLGSSVANSAINSVGDSLKGRELGFDALAPWMEATAGGEGAPIELPERTSKTPATPIQERPLYRAGEAIKEFADRTFALTPEQRASMTGRIGGGIGGFLPPFLMGLVGSAIGHPELGMLAGIGQIASSAAGETFDAATAKGASPEQAARAAGLSAIVNGGLGAVRLDRVLAPVQSAAPGLVGWAAAKLEQGLRSGVTFAGTGEAQAWLGAEIAKHFYDPQAGYKPDIERVLANLTGGFAVGMAAPRGGARGEWPLGGTREPAKPSTDFGRDDHEVGPYEENPGGPPPDEQSAPERSEEKGRETGPSDSQGSTEQPRQSWPGSGARVSELPLSGGGPRTIGPKDLARSSRSPDFRSQGDGNEQTGQETGPSDFDGTAQQPDSSMSSRNRLPGARPGIGHNSSRFRRGAPEDLRAESLPPLPRVLPRERDVGKSLALEAAKDPVGFGEALQAVLQQNPADYANARADFLQKQLPPVMRDSVTIAVGVLENAQGVRYVVVSSSESNRYGESRFHSNVKRAFHPDEIRARSGDHAEINIVNDAKDNKHKLIAVGAGRPYCDRCVRAIEGAGGLATGPRKSPAR